MTREYSPSRWRALFRCLALLGLGVLAAACGDDAPSEYTYAEVKEDVRRRIQSEMAQSQVRGLSIALVDGQQVVWSEGFGFADEEARRPATPETVYEAGSLSKVFTATALMQQVEQGRATLDQPLPELIPGFTLRSRFTDTGPITLRHLLTHHAGMPEHFAGVYAPRILSLAERVESLREEYPAYPVGRFWAYSNTGFVVAGRALETTSGQEFTAAMQQHLLGPLGMTRSSFRLEPHLAPDLAVGYGPLAASDVPPHWLDSEGPAGSLRSTVLDLSLFIKMLLAGGQAGEVRLLQPGTLQEMWTQQNPGTPLDLDTRIGLTWYLRDLPLTNGQSARLVEHDGATHYFHSMLALLPEHQLGVVVLANTEGAGRLVASVARDALARALRAKSGLRVASSAGSPGVPPASRPVEELRALEGLYASEGGLMKVAMEEGTLVAQVAGLRLALVPHAQGFFRTHIQGTPLWLSFERIDGHDVCLVHDASSGRQLLGVRVPPAGVPEPWRHRLGQYTPPPGAPRQLVVRAGPVPEGGLLVLRAHGALLEVELLLEPDGEERAVVLGLGRGKGEVIRFEQEENALFMTVKGVRLRLESAVP